jgi:dTMP kinase
MKKGLFITFEGPDGSGKTTVSTSVVERLQKEGYQVKYTREPGGSNIAEQIRSVILDPKNTEMDARCEALLYAAARRQHLVEKVLPALEEGITVISDRFVDSSLAYQGYGRGIGVEEVYSINMFAIEGKLPDRTIYLNIDAKTGLDRINANRTSLDRLDQESEDFHNLVHKGYEEVVERYKDRMDIVDASKDVEMVIEESYQIVKGLLDA